MAAPGRRREVAGLARKIPLPDRVSGSLNRKLGYIRLRFRRVTRKYGNSWICARGRFGAPRTAETAWPQNGFASDQNGLTITRITIPIIRRVGTSLIIR